MTGMIRGLAALGLAALATLVVAGPAAAAARADIILTVNGDGAGGVTVLASYADGGRPFEKGLYIDENTGGNAVGIDTANPQTVDATVWGERPGPGERGEPAPPRRASRTPHPR